MAYIPPDAEWYLAHIVETITVEGNPRYAVHTNMVLVRADSPDEAFAKAEELGRAGEIAYENPAGKRLPTGRSMFPKTLLKCFGSGFRT